MRILPHEVLQWMLATSVEPRISAILRPRDTWDGFTHTLVPREEAAPSDGMAKTSKFDGL